MTNPVQLTQIIRCSVALGGVIRPDPSAMYSSIGLERLTKGAGGFVSILEGREGEKEEGGEESVQDSRIDGPWRRIERERR